MKRILFIIAFLIFTICGYAQSTPKSTQNNGSSKVIISKSSSSDTTTISYTNTGYFYQYKEKNYPIYKGKKGGYFIFTGKNDKDGKPIKKYITNEVKETIEGTN